MDLLKSDKIRYIIVGVATTLINFVAFAILNQFLYVDIANFISIFISIVFAYFMTSGYVFKTENSKNAQTFMMFMSGRVVTLLVELVGVHVLFVQLSIDAFFSKIIMNVIVIILNYIISKKIFKQGGV